jgi:hypothetical protein
MRDSFRTHWDVLGFFYNTFHDRPVLNNVRQVRFILHVEHERSCIDSMVENWAMMQRRLPCQLGFLWQAAWHHDTNMIQIWSAAMQSMTRSHLTELRELSDSLCKSPRHAELQGDEWLFPPEWARGKGGLHVVPWYQPNARPITSKIFKVIHNPWESMRIHESAGQSREGFLRSLPQFT